MKTNLELPDEFAHRFNMRAVERNQKLEDTVAQLLEPGLANTPKKDALAHVPKPVQLKERGPRRLGIPPWHPATASAFGLTPGGTCFLVKPERQPIPMQ